MAVFPHNPHFIAALKTGRVYEEKVAARLRERGLVVFVEPLIVRREDQDTDEFRGQTDIWVSRPGGTPAPVEVKSPRYRFTGPHDWKFDTVFCYATTKPDPTLPVLCISRQTEVIVGVLDYGEGRFRSMTSDGRDHRGGEPYEVWNAPLSSLLTFDQWIDRIGEYLME